MVACSRMLWLPVSTQTVLCTMRSLIASAWTPEPSRWCQSFLAYRVQNAVGARPVDLNRLTGLVPDPRRRPGYQHMPLVGPAEPVIAHRRLAGGGA